MTTANAISQEQLSDLIGKIYDAATDRDQWPVFLDHLAAALHATSTALLHQDLNVRHDQISAIVRIAPEVLQAYQDYYVTLNPWVAGAKAKGLIFPGCVVVGEAAFPDRELKRTEFYADWMKPANLRHEFGCNVFLTKDRMTNVTVLRPARAGPFDREEVRLLETLVPHLQRAIQIHRRVVELDSQNRNRGDALDLISTGVILLDSSGNVVFANRSVRAMVAARDGLTLTAQGLRAGPADETAALAKLIAGAVQTGSGQGMSSGGFVAVSRRSLKRPYAVLVTPLPRSNREEELAGAAVIFVSDPEQKVEADESLLRHLFGLTRAEARLAALLVMGRSVAQASQELDVSINTTRTHLKRVFEKTDTHRHPELLRILLTAGAAARR